MNRSLHSWSKYILPIIALTLFNLSCIAHENNLQHAKTLQRSGQHYEAIEVYKKCLLQPIEGKDPNSQELFTYVESLIQLMNSYQSLGKPDECIATLQSVFKINPVLQKQCLRDYYAVLGYALSRTERMQEAEETTMKALTLPLYQGTPERYFRDYAYAAAVFYSNPYYQKEVINWCEEAILQAQLCKNTSGKQWVMAMLGSLYKRSGQFNKALELFKQSNEEAKERNDELSELNSLNTITDFLLYWDIPEYANHYASQAVRLEEQMHAENPMITTQSYINKGRALLQLGVLDSVGYYVEKARNLCQTLPYNSGMVDVDLLSGTLLTAISSDSLQAGIQKLLRVAQQGTVLNRAKAYHQLAQTYLMQQKALLGEKMLDSLYHILNQSDSPIYIRLNYEPILNHYLAKKDYHRVEQFVKRMHQEQETFNEKKLKFNIIETIIDQQTEQDRQQVKIAQLKQNNQRLKFLVFTFVAILFMAAIVTLLFYQKKQHKIELKQADEKLNSLTKILNQLGSEKEIRAQEIKNFLNDKENRQELETLTPSILQTSGETKFRQCFELLHPLFLPRLREKVPTITRREELLSMLIVLKQGNKEIAELFAIAPRSVLMLRHRLRQKIGMTTEHSLEDFITEILSDH